MHNAHPHYRPDIDGLRAIAILCVVIFHAFPDKLSGGFVGVDVFFVISGFLISTILYKSLEHGDFSFVDFYGRRIRRIFPAFILVLAATYAAGWYMLLTDEFKQLGSHIAASAGFVQNFVLNQEAGYFDVSSELKPLAHIWSLSVEEQFYLVFPVLVWGIWRTGLNALSVIVLLALISMGLNISAAYKNVTLAFYMPQTRFWELFAGAVLAYLQLFRAARLSHLLKAAIFNSWVFKSPPATDRRDAVMANLIAVLGFLLVISAALGLDRTKPYPSGWALIPVLGACLLILAGPVAWVNRRILTSRVMVQIGLVSYPLYLWHWPLLAFARIMENEVPSLEITFIAVVLSFFLAWLTYHLVERPLRVKGSGRIQTLILFFLLVLIGCVGYTTYLRDGLEFRKFAFPFVFEGDVGQTEFYAYISKRYYPCSNREIAKESLKWEQYTRCYQSQNREDIDVALIGDSHAEHLFIGLAEQLPDKNVVYYIRDGPAFIDAPEYADIYKSVIESKSIKKVVFTMSWIKRRTQLVGKETLEQRISKTTRALMDAGKDVFISDDNPVFAYDPKACKVNRSLSFKSNCSRDRLDAIWVLDQYRDSLEEVVRKDPRIKYMKTYEYFCNTIECSMVNGTKLLYRDKNHLNINGSRFIAQKIMDDNPSLR